jgi:hypothetical protein
MNHSEPFQLQADPKDASNHIPVHEGYSAFQTEYYLENGRLLEPDELIAYAEGDYNYYNFVPTILPDQNEDRYYDTLRQNADEALVEYSRHREDLSGLLQREYPAFSDPHYAKHLAGKLVASMRRFSESTAYARHIRSARGYTPSLF